MRCICTSTSLKGTVIPSNVNIERAFEAERAIKLYGEMLHSLAFSRCKSKEDAEDVCQEVLIALLNRKEPFKNNEHMKAWLIRAALHRSKNTHRYENRHPRTPYDPALHDRPEQDSTTDCEKLHDAVESLSEELKETLRLYYRDGYSAKEIASLKGVGKGNGKASVTFEANLTWSITGIERVTYSTDAENTKLYSPGIGNYYILNQGELGSTRDATLTSNGNATIALNIEVSITAGENASNSELCDIAKSALDKKSLIATAYLENGTSETAECLFTE